VHVWLRIVRYCFHTKIAAPRAFLLLPASAKRLLFAVHHDGCAWHFAGALIAIQSGVQDCFPLPYLLCARAQPRNVSTLQGLFGGSFLFGILSQLVLFVIAVARTDWQHQVRLSCVQLWLLVLLISDSCKVDLLRSCTRSMTIQCKPLILRLKLSSTHNPYRIMSVGEDWSCGNHKAGLH
jgi:hypothetical protein